MWLILHFPYYEEQSSQQPNSSKTSQVLFWELGRNAELTQNLHFNKLPQGFICMESTALNNINCQLLGLCFLTWSTLFASLIPGSSHVLQALCFPSLVHDFNPLSNTLNALTPVVSISVYRIPTIHFLHFVVVFLRPWHLQCWASCFVEPIRAFLINS